MRAWLDHARTHPAVHPTFAGSIGYCLGGQSLLEQVRDGQDVQAGSYYPCPSSCYGRVKLARLDCLHSTVVSFHGLLHSRPPPIDGKKTDPRGGFFERMTKEEFESDDSIEKAENCHNTACKILIENGDLDPHVPIESVEEFKAEMDPLGIDWYITHK